MRIALALAFMIVTSFGCSSAKVAGFFVDSSAADAWYIKAGLYEQDKDFEEASRLLEAVLETMNDEHVYLRLAGIYMQMRDETMARLTLERGVRKNPESAMLLGELAARYSADERFYGKAKDIFTQIYEKSGESIYAVQLANLLVMMKDYNGAIKIYDLLIEKDERSDYYIQRGKLYQELGLDKDSIADFIAAAELDENFFAAARLSDYYIKSGDDEKAIKYLRMVIRKSPDMVLAKFRLAELLRKRGELDEAVTFYETIIEKLNRDEQIYVLKQVAGIYYRSGQFEKAKDYFKSAYEIDKDIQTAYSIALVKEAAGDNAGAAEWYNSILKKRPDFNEAIKRLAIIKIKQNKPEEALITIDRMEELYRTVDYARIKAEALMVIGRFDEGRKVLEDAIEKNPADDKLYVDLAIGYESRGMYDEAVDVVIRGMRYHADSPSYQNLLGYVYAQMGENLEKAEELVAKALEKKPDEPAYLDSMGWVLYKMGRYKEAYEFQKRSLKLVPDEEDIREHMRLILKKLKSKKSLKDVIEED